MWLGNGCISFRQIVHEVAEFERANASTQETYNIVFELIWRDFSTLSAITAQYKDKKTEAPPLFAYGGNWRNPEKWSTSHPVKNDEKDFKAWCEGKTGFPFVDACIREMTKTGFMPNRGRMTTASFLIYTLQTDWRYGAEFFEHHLIDHNVGANYVNWQMASGIGWNPMSIVFNAVRQSLKYEPDPLFIKKWVPELENCPDKLVHTGGV